MNGSASDIRGAGFRVVGAVLGGIVLCSAAAVRAQDLQVTPLSWDYGPVVAGTSVTKTFDLLGGWPTEGWVYVVYLSETPVLSPPYADPHFADPGFDTWSLGAFSFDSSTWVTLPRTLPVGEHLFVDVTFTPPSPGDYSVYLGILSNDSIGLPGPIAHLPLEGTGVPAAVPVPVPGAALLGIIGLGCVSWRLRRRTS